MPNQFLRDIKMKMNKLMINKNKPSPVQTSSPDPSYKKALFSPILDHRQSSDPTMASPSIALLQERFRHLEKVKERREEKDLLKLLSETEKQSSTAQTMHSETSKSSFQPEMIAPQRSNLQDPLSLGLNLQSKQDDFRDAKMLPSTNLWPSNGAATASRSRRSENSDVDTSLHL